MIILGYSGLFNSENYVKRANKLRDGEEKMIQGTDSAACLLIDGKIVACAEEERFVGKKHTCEFPKNAINYCLREAGISIYDVNLFCHGFDYESCRQTYIELDKNLYKNVYSKEIQISKWKEEYNIELNDDNFILVDHHLAHASSAYFMSGFNKSLCCVCDGMGERNSMTMYLVENNLFSKVGQVGIKNSIGILYSVITYFLGYEFNEDEYKIMGLAAYGNPKIYREFFNKLITFKDNGKYDINWSRYGVDVSGDYFHRKKIEYLKDVLFEGRTLSEREKSNFAASLQEITEKVFEHFLKYYREKYNIKSICMAGGVLLNCKNNGNILSSGLFEQIYIQPAAGDAGTALGAALYISNKYDINHIFKNFNDLPFYGPRYSDKDYFVSIQKHISKVDFYKFSSFENTYMDAAKEINEEKVIGWFQGRMEFGPRALGARSIVANPRCKNIKQRLNSIVKFRESYRPFAPAILQEDAHIYFEFNDSEIFKYMLATCLVKEKYRSLLIGITHEDGTARMQLVDEQNTYFYGLLKSLKKICGNSCIVNTSFNVKGQPMICSPIIALETFLKIDMDVLYLGNYKVIKKNRS